MGSALRSARCSKCPLYMAVSTWGKSSTAVLPLQICLFDSRRGDREGEEEDKLLGFYPANVPSLEQCSIVGLAQAAITFASTFNPAKPCNSIQTEHTRWVLVECEPHLWLLLAAAREWSKGPAREEGLRAALKQYHQLFTLAHGPLQQLLTQDSSGKAARAAVGVALEEFGGRLAQLRGPEYAALHNPLAAFDAVPYLQLPQPAFLGMQSLVNRVLMAPTLSSVGVSGVVLLHEHWLLWSTLDQPATNSLCQLFSWTILPAIRAASQTSFSRRLTTSRSAAGKARSLLSKGAWELQQNGVLLLAGEPPASAVSGPDPILHTASVYIQSLQEWCSLLVMRAAEEVLLLLLPDETSATVSAAEGCLTLAEPLLKALSATVAQHLQAIRRHHVPTIRYLFTDDLLGMVRASPGNKIATLARNSLALANSVRADLEACLDDSQERYTEVAVWGQQDCWVMAKRRGSRLLIIVLETHGKEGLLAACEGADSFAAANFPVMFQ